MVRNPLIILPKAETLFAMPNKSPPPAPSLDDLLVFAAVAEAEGFSAAARRLGVSKSMVSSAVSRLEARLGVRLLQRTTRRLSLTEAGHAVLPHARQARSAAHDAEEAALSLLASPRGLLRVNAPMSFGVLHLAPALGAFANQYPEVEVELVLDDRVVDLVGGDFDLAIRIGTLADSSLVASTLGRTPAFDPHAAFFATRPLLSMLPKGDGHPVLVLPGFMASDASTKPMRGLLDDLGYEAHGWGLGRNVRIDATREREMNDVLKRIADKAGRKVSIVGWSLGGVFARELAKQMPDKVRQVITLGSPISDNRRFTNARPLFEAINGRRPEPMKTGRFRKLADAPPVPTTSILTKGDGVVHWRGSVQHPDRNPLTENIEVYASHIGLGVNPAVMLAIADRLAQAEGAWKPFSARGIASLAFPTVRVH